MLEKLSGDAVEPDQLARLHNIGLSQPLRPAQGPAGAEVEWWKLGSMVLGRALYFRASVLWYVVFFSMVVDDRGLNLEGKGILTPRRSSRERINFTGSTAHASAAKLN